jgi:NAD(P)H-hydrate epimerase
MHTVSRSAVPALTTEQMREVDRAMVEDLHIELVQMMENAGRNLAELAMTRFSPSSVTVLAGPGGNGGGGLLPPATWSTVALRFRSCSPNRAA